MKPGASVTCSNSPKHLLGKYQVLELLLCEVDTPVWVRSYQKWIYSNKWHFSNTVFFKADTLAGALTLTNRCDIWQHCPHTLDTVCNVCLSQCTQCKQTSRTPKRSFMCANFRNLPHTPKRGFICANFRNLPQSRFCHSVTRWADLCMLLLVFHVDRLWQDGASNASWRQHKALSHLLER